MSFLDDPDWNLVDNTFVKICGEPEESLSPNERILVNVWHTFGLIQNGGFHNFLCCTDMDLDELLKDYRVLKVKDASEPLEEAVSLLRQWLRETKTGDPDADEFRDRYEDKLDSAEERYYEAEKALVTALANLIKA